MKCGSKWNAAPGSVSPYNECISIHTILLLSLQSMQFWDLNHFILMILFIILKGLSLIRLITIDSMVHSFSFASALATVVSCNVNKLVCLLICTTIMWQLFLNHCCTQSLFKIFSLWVYMDSYGILFSLPGSMSPFCYPWLWFSPHHCVKFLYLSLKSLHASW